MLLIKEKTAEGLKPLRKISYLFLIISFFIINLNFIVYASPRGKNENAKEITEKNQQIKTKKKYNWEFSIAASAGLRIEPWIDGSLSTITFSVPARIGYFLGEKIEIEPEITFMFEKPNGTYETNTLLLANIVYNFNRSSKVNPFILAGGGIIMYSEESDIQVVDSESWIETHVAMNIGAGIKWFISKQFAFRVEYRFIIYQDNADNITYHNIITGVSIFF